MKAAAILQFLADDILSGFYFFRQFRKQFDHVFVNFL